MTKFQQWWARRTNCDSEEHACLQNRFKEWVIRELAHMKKNVPDELKHAPPFGGLRDKQVQDNAIAYLEEQTLKPTTDDLATLTGGFLGANVTGDARLLRLDELPFASGNFEMLMQTFVASVTAYCFLRESEPNSPARQRAIEQFFQSTSLPAERAARWRRRVHVGDNESFSNAFASAFKVEVNSFLTGPKCWTDQIPPTFAKALGQITRRVWQGAFDEWRKILAASTATGASGARSFKKQVAEPAKDRQDYREYEENVRKFLRASKQPQGVQSLSKSRSGADGDDGNRPQDRLDMASTQSHQKESCSTLLGLDPELFEALFHICWKAADRCPDDKPRQLLQLMLGGVSHSKRSAEPWSLLPWGVQPELIDAVLSTFGRYAIRDVEGTVADKLNEEWDAQVILDAMIQCRNRQAESQSIEDRDDRLTAQKQIEEHHRWRAKADAIRRKADWAQFKSVAKEAAARLARQVLYEAHQLAPDAHSKSDKAAALQAALDRLNLTPPSDLILTDPGSAANVRDDLEAWLDMKNRPVIPSPDQAAWVAKTLWELQ